MKLNTEIPVSPRPHGTRGTGTVRPVAASSGALRAAFLLSGVIAGLMVVASVLGLSVHGLYPGGSWAREALRGGDLTTLVFAVPLLVASLALSVRGSRRAQAMWIARSRTWT